VSALDRITREAGPSARLVDRLARRLGGLSRRGFLARTAVVGSALAVDPRGYVLTPRRAYSTICGPANTAASGYSVFCCTVNKGVNACPPGTFTAGWWKAADSSWCCGGYRYFIDCNAKCVSCSNGCASDHLCDRTCWNCSCGQGSKATCDQRRHCCNAFRYGQCNTHVRCSGGVACRVVSCVPPYRWDSCANITLFDNATAEQSAPCLQGCGAILRRYDELGANGSYLGASLGPERAVGDGAGRHVDYRGGSIYWTSRTGARAIHGSARSAWLRSGGPRGPLGYPTGERVTRPDSSWDQRFQQGVVCDGPRTRTSVVHGAVYRKWAALGGIRGRLGYPRRDSRNGRDGRGRGQVFVGGQVWARSGEPAFAVTGRVLDRWLADGAETGRWGYPTGDVRVLADGTQRGTFEKGTITVRPS
jgi:hypothetical protein